MQCTVYQLGRIEFAEAFELQKRLLGERLEGRIDDALLLLGHPPTITVGKSGKLENILASPAMLAREGVSLVFTDRGGDVTYHGPGQIVGYPILDLRERGRDAHKYVRDLEEVLIRTLKDFSIDSGRDSGHAGVWVDNEEIAALGLSIRKWITMHGFALNVNPDMAHFALINPCGFSNRRATSIIQLLGHDVSIEMVTEKLLGHFADVFTAQLDAKTGTPDAGYHERQTANLV
jgi:lipoate-protein ligase B